MIRDDHKRAAVLCEDPCRSSTIKDFLHIFFYNSVLDRNIICRLLSPAIPSESPFYAYRSEDYFFFFTDIEICPKVASVIKKTMKTGYPTRII